MQNNILIISYTFPPLPGIGGRRWAKFSKYFLSSGIKPIVVYCENTLPSISTYSKDVENSDIVKIPMPLHRFKYVATPATNFCQKIVQKFQYSIINFYSKGNAYDKGLFWDKYFKKEIPEIIRKYKIQKVILSGPPFHYFFYALQLKDHFPNLDLIVDYRDPWSEQLKYQKAPEREIRSRYEHESAMEKKVLTTVNKVICVSQFQAELLKNKVPDHKLNIHVVRNGYDEADFNGVTSKSAPPDSDFFEIAHIGTLNFEKKYYYESLLRAVSLLKENNIKSYSKLRINFAGVISQKNDFLDLCRKYDVLDAVIYHGVIKHEKAMEILKRANLVLWFKYDQSAGDYATKFYEYVYLRKFIWTFTIPGEAAEYIERNKIGKVFYKESKDLTSEIYAELNKAIINPPVFNKEFDADQFSIATITKKLIEVVYS